MPGNLTKLSFNYKDESYAIAALYAPNTTDLPFYQKLFEMETDPQYTHTIYLGDWNISLNQQLDTQGYLHENNVVNRDYVRAKMIEFELSDAWRERNPLETKFTFMKKQAKNTTKARLDFFLAGKTQ